MRNFSWVIPGKLAGLAMVGRWAPLERELEELASGGVTLLCTLTEEAIDAASVRAAGIEPLHLPVRDFSPPTLAQLDQFVASARAAIDKGGAAAVHCFAGMGRTGTCLAAYLVSTGATAVDAIARVRQLRPGSIESWEQEDAVTEFAGRGPRVGT